ncbi:MAG: Segregation and condensation protein A [Candidatus Uhrbacteria bacterium GW2011_GWE2_40_58]|nr:MAG: Segregation and condensation protein A [Candidatus Uhrbacteria bacterium GW2011_GWF2_40_263]KKR66880.1 MAG: Segregation and condensation protein A [Candidatus Uhrbacteria bacterium GW2011_GWE2_40_58]OGL93828.1 MAG: hypothetical protein A2239_03990 [Candidatus Uhrbacteria bacterium RIFOXYA2_FULL_40_9]OGL97980.1 MAG: hypothetical protein A2332_00570 [Candidatus Uhrbacteria bacterium RIFOXYB2_FULL_41_18]HBK35246.1 hypothetical protein [Candidatus Uhrbacteria bacterium]
MSFELKTEKFSGPLQLLLELINEQKLPINEISLAEVTEAYLQHVKQEEVPPEELADFLLIATRLLYLKSKILLPEIVEEEEEGTSDLVDQLKMYEKFVRASVYLEERYTAHFQLFPRSRTILKQEKGFYPPENATPKALQESFLLLLKRLEPWAKLRKASVQKVISLSERIEDLRQAFLSRSQARFQDIIKGAQKVDVVVSFLALLELLREQHFKVTQSEQFHDIIIKRVD